MKLEISAAGLYALKLQRSVLLSTAVRESSRDLNGDVKTWQWVGGAWKLKGGVFGFSSLLCKSWKKEVTMSPAIQGSPPATKLDWSIPLLFPSNAPFHNSAVGFPSLRLQGTFFRATLENCDGNRSWNLQHKKGVLQFRFYESSCAAYSNKKYSEMFSISRPLFLSSDFQEFNVPLKQELGTVALK